MSLTPNAVRLMRTKGHAFDVKPVVQVVRLHEIENQGAQKRYKIDVSDGTAFATGMLATHFNELVRGGALKVNSLVRIKEHIVSEVQAREVLILLDLDVVATEHARVGNPVELGASGASAAPAHAPAPAPAAAPAPQPNRVYASVPPAVPPPTYGHGASAPAPALAPAPAKPAPSGSGAVATFAYSSAGAGAGAGAAPDPNEPRTVGIRSLNPYMNRWTIKARVTSKSDVRTWDKGPSNQGKLFSVDLVDEEGGEIRATFFREAVDQFFDLVQVGGVYFVGGGKLKVANRQFSNVNNDYEISLDRNSTVVRSADSGRIARIQVNPVPIAELNNRNAKERVDVVGVVTSVGDITSFTSKQGRDLKKAEVELVDDSLASIRLALWGNKADELVPQLHVAGANCVLALKGVEVGDYGGRTLSSGSGTSFAINPDIPAAARVRAWFDRGGSTQGVTSLSGGPGGGAGGSGGGGGGRGPVPIEQRVTFDVIQQAQIGVGAPNAAYVEVKGWIAYVRRENMWYPACPTDKCNKKMTKSPADDRWVCEKCNLTFDAPVYRYIASFDVQDSTGHHWVSAFNNETAALLGRSADELERMSREDEPGFQRVIDDALFRKGVFRLKVKEETYQDQVKLKYTLMDFRPIDWVNECKELERAIKALEMR